MPLEESHANDATRNTDLAADALPEDNTAADPATSADIGGYNWHCVVWHCVD